MPKRFAVGLMSLMELASRTYAGIGGRLMRKEILFLPAAICFALSVFSHAAFADAIDGDWCSSDGKRMTIRGHLHHDSWRATSDWRLYPSLLFVCHSSR